MVEVGLLTVFLPFFLILYVDGTPLAVGTESHLDLLHDVPSPEDGDHLACDGVGLSLGVGKDREEDVSWDDQDPCNNIWVKIILEFP